MQERGVGLPACIAIEVSMNTCCRLCAELCFPAGLAIDQQAYGDQ